MSVFVFVQCCLIVFHNGLFDFKLSEIMNKITISNKFFYTVKAIILPPGGTLNHVNRLHQSETGRCTQPG